LIKRALLFAERIVGRMLDQGQRSAVMLQGRLNGCLAAFAEVDDRVELWEVRLCKRNKLYREYEEAVKLAKMILRRYDNSIDRASAEEHAIPAFWIDMSLLYEHYVLGALRKAYGSKILYQANMTTGKPDFLYDDEERPLILDTKYKPRYGTGTFDKDDVRQLAGYARDRKVLKRLGIQEAEEQDSAVVPCVIIYPETRGEDVKFDKTRSPIDQECLEVVPMREFVGFYRMGFPLPVLKSYCQIQDCNP
jgi:5-methylcytosine-specific restriction enzyme subunit McrC